MKRFILVFIAFTFSFLIGCTTTRKCGNGDTVVIHRNPAKHYNGHVKAFSATVEDIKLSLATAVTSIDLEGIDVRNNVTLLQEKMNQSNIRYNNTLKSYVLIAAARPCDASFQERLADYIERTQSEQEKLDRLSLQFRMAADHQSPDLFRKALAAFINLPSPAVPNADTYQSATNSVYVLIADLIFEKGEYEISSDMDSSLAHIGQLLRGIKTGDLFVIGYADLDRPLTGGDGNDYWSNHELSRKRAANVAHWLETKYGITNYKILGASDLQASMPRTEGLSSSFFRRVELVYSPSGGLPKEYFR